MGRGSLRKRAKRVSRKPKLKRMPKLPGSVPAELRKLWDTRKTLKENYAAIGLATTLNAKKIKPATGELKIKVPEEAPPREPRLSHSEISYLYTLVNCHGDNYGAMARDIKRNYYQHTESKLRRMVELYFLKYAGGPMDTAGGREQFADIAAERAALERERQRRQQEVAAAQQEEEEEDEDEDAEDDADDAEDDDDDAEDDADELDSLYSNFNPDAEDSEEGDDDDDDDDDDE